ncbi:hypothetical protein E8E12_010143 [Didymella heteroderae]|uniref:Uncharacterized protein n=1 Tax=Didymella heteroderae TaxID=1769908 RepID=A0A9P5C6M4_9PLEO|nr:hypothetical protein E8E12_010143 [Didymella heteroderae]
MQLLQLPKETFAQVVDIIVKDEEGLSGDIRGIVCYRLVCRKSIAVTQWMCLISTGTFDDFFTANIVEHAARDNIAEPTYLRLDRTHRHRLVMSAILQRKITPGKDKRALLRNLTTLVDGLVEREWPSSNKHAGELRVWYTNNVCHTLRALQYDKLFATKGKPLHPGPTALQDVLLAASAAIGNVQMFLNNAHSIEDILQAGDKAFPNALSAAVTASQTETSSTSYGGASRGFFAASFAVDGLTCTYPRAQYRSGLPSKPVATRWRKFCSRKSATDAVALGQTLSAY